MESSDPGPARPLSTRRTYFRPGRAVLAALLAASALTACGHFSTAESQADRPGFNNQNAQTITCMAHQTRPPDARYTPGHDADTGHILLLMQYYTANGDKPFCGQNRPSKADAEWAQLYINLGGEPAKVARITDANLRKG